MAGDKHEKFERDGIVFSFFLFFLVIGCDIFGYWKFGFGGYISAICIVMGLMMYFGATKQKA